MDNTVTQRRGFAAMSPEKRREISRKGGRAAHQKGTAHQWTSEEARVAGRKGGAISRRGRARLVTPASATPSDLTDHEPAELPDERIPDERPQPMKGGGEVVMANERTERVLRLIAAGVGVPYEYLVRDYDSEEWKDEDSIREGI